MSQRYDIFFAAQLVDGFEEATVRANLGALFKASDETLDKLFSGKAQLIKRGVEKQAAIKYKAALQKAGAVALIRANPPLPKKAPAPQPPPAHQEEDLPSSADIKSGAEPAAEKSEGGMAARVAALAEQAESGAFSPDLSLAPVGSDVLREDEREVFEELDIDTSGINLASSFVEPEPLQQEPPPPPPDTSHMSLGEAGEEIPHLEPEVEPVDPDISHLSMGEVGEDIPHLEPDVEPVDPDTSNISLAPEGSEVLEEKYRKHGETAAAPNTDHLSLED